MILSSSILECLLFIVSPFVAPCVIHEQLRKLNVVFFATRLRARALIASIAYDDAHAFVVYLSYTTGVAYSLSSFSFSLNLNFSFSLSFSSRFAPAPKIHLRSFLHEGRGVYAPAQDSL